MIRILFFLLAITGLIVGVLLCIDYFTGHRLRYMIEKIRYWKQQQENEINKKIDELNNN